MLGTKLEKAVASIPKLLKLAGHGCKNFLSSGNKNIFLDSMGCITTNPEN
jgi:hypothetical protein